MNRETENKIVTLTAKVPPEFAQAVKDAHKQFNVELVEMIDAHKEAEFPKLFRILSRWKQVTVSGLYNDLWQLNHHCQRVAYCKCDTHELCVFCFNDR